MTTGVVAPAPAPTGGGSSGSAPAPTSTGGAPSSTGGGASFLQSSSGQALTAPTTWGDDWRKRIAGEDAQELKRLERFQGPENIYKSYRELENKLAAGELLPTLRKDATADEVTRWRKSMGVPEKPEAYAINMPDGYQGKAPKQDDAFLGAFLKSAHEANYTQAQVDGALKMWYSEITRQTTAIGEAERAAEAACEDVLRKDWGADYRPNKAMTEALLARAPAGFRDRFMGGYLADHTPIRASPEAWKWLAQMEREINPAASVVPGAGGDLGKTVEAELLELKKEMAITGGPYWKGPEAEKKQARYRELLNAAAQLKARAAA